MGTEGGVVTPGLGAGEVSVSWGQRFSLGRVMAWSLCGYTQALLGAPWGSDSCSQGPAQRLVSWAAAVLLLQHPCGGPFPAPCAGGEHRGTRQTCPGCHLHSLMLAGSVSVS